MKTVQSVKENSPKEVKRSYRAPKLKRKGDIKKLTMATGSSTSDGGTQFDD